MTSATIDSQSVSRRILSGSIAAVVLALLGNSSAAAAPLYWDTNDVTPGSGAPTGTWGTDSFWTFDATGSSTPTIAYVAGSDVVFSAGTNGTTGTVSITGTQVANSITFDDNVALTLSTIAAGTASITLGGTTGQGIFVAAGDNAANTISTGITFDPAAVPLLQNAGTGLLTVGALGGAATSGLQTITFASQSSGGITASGIISDGTGGGKVAVVLANTGTGVTTFSGVNTFTGGLTIGANTLRLGASTTTLGGATNAVSINGGTLQSGNGGTMVTIAQPISIGANGATLSSVGSSGKFMITGLVSGAGNLIRNGTAITAFTGIGTTNDMQLNGNNTGFTGAVILNGGATEVSGNSLGNGLTAGNTITISSGAELVANAAPVVNKLIVNNGAFLSAVGTGTKEFSGAMATSGSFTVRMGDFYEAVNRNLTLSGALSGSGIFNLSSGATLNATGQYLTLSGNNSAYSAGITAAAGYSILFNQTSSIGTGGLKVAANAAQLGGIGFAYDFGATLPAFTVNRVGTTTGGVFGINANLASTTTLDLSTLGGGGMFLGSINNTGTYSATTLGADGGVYRLGGGGGTLTFTGASALTGTNSLVVNDPRTNGGGTVVLAALADYFGGTTINAGSLKLDFSAATAPTDNLISGTSGLTMQGGNLTLVGRAGGSSTQSFPITSVNGAATVTLTPSGTNALMLTHGTIVRGNGAILTESSITSQAGYTMGGIATTDSFNNSAGILGTWAFAGSGTTTRYATRSDTSVQGQILAVADNPAATAANLTDTTGLLNYSLAAVTGPTPASVSANTIRYTGVAGTLAPGATLFQVNGLLNAGTGLLTIGTGPITIGSDRELVINAANAGFTISSVIADNAGGPSAVTVTGGTAVTLSGVNTFSGGLNVTNGTVTFNNNNLFLGASGKPITLNGGVLNSTNVSGTVTLDHPIIIGPNGGTIATAGATTNGKISMNASLLSGSGTFIHTGASDLQMQIAASPFTGTFVVGGVVEASLTGALGTGPIIVNAGGELVVNTGITFNNPFTLNSGGLLSPIGAGNASGISASSTVYAAGNFGIGLRDFHALGTALGFFIAAPISGTGNLDIAAVSTAAANRQTVLLSGNNSNWSGNISTSAATATEGVTLRLGSTSALGNSTGFTTITPGALLDLNGITLANAEPLFIGGTGPTAFPTALTNESATPATFSGPITLTANTTMGSINGGVSGGNITLSGNIGGAFGITKDNGITQNVTLSGNNTFTGNVTVKAGPLTITNSNALGTGAKTVTIVPTTNPTSLPGLFLDGSGGNITLPSTMSFSTSNDGYISGVLQAPTAAAITNVAGDNTVNGNFTMVGGGGGTALNVVGGISTINGNASIIGGGTARNVVLRGNGNGTFAGNISNGGATVGLQRDLGTGKWTLAGTNTYTGATAVSAGTLEVAGTLSGTSSISVTTGSTLLLSGAGESVADTVGAINNAATVLIDGSTLKVSGANQVETMGALTLNTNAAIDFNSAASTNTLSFQFLTLTPSATGFNILHWSGSIYDVSASADNGLPQDHFAFTLDPGNAVANQISFFNDSGTFLGTGQSINYGTGFEIVPVVPEPSSILLAGLGILGLTQTRRRRRA